ncbi:tetratricopeptide repeat-containing sensor histidine kinase [Altibacter sp. HG106]|uniref:tetratricopeptide repeat-containing sensor histidine kinase n=1 Tax=Altibacter sp. HG106 TaxID=3023937 RepID=UPI00234FC4A8|nr:histidine kinase [Altibacter sp. HG106]MDC7994285.1 histidine kinase [Altibacter sp. HG106]
MRILTIILFVASLCMACENVRKDSQFSYNELWDLQSKAYRTPSDSLPIYLDSIERIMSRTKMLPDSIQARYYDLQGMRLLDTDELNRAAESFQKSIYLIKKPLRNLYVVHYFNHAFKAYLDLGEYGNAVAVGERYLEVIPADDNRLRAHGLYYLSEAYKTAANFDKAVFYNQQKIELLQQNKDTIALVSALLTQAKLLYHQSNRSKDALVVLDSIQKSNWTLSPDLERQLYGTLGVYHFLDGDFDSAITDYQKSLLATKKITPLPSNSKSLLARGYANLAEAFIWKEAYLDARKYLDSVRLIGIHNINRELRNSILKYELQLATATDKNIDLLLRNLDTLEKYQNLQYEKKMEKELVALSNANENEKRLLREKQLSEIRNIELRIGLYVAIFGLILASIIGYLWYRQRQLRFERKSLQMQQQLLRSQMNPHFTFNTLYAIQQQVTTEPERATSYLLGFSKLLRLILENSTNSYVLLEKELTAVREYLELQLLRTPEKFTYQFNLVSLSEDDFIFIPPMLLQPIVENCIEHGFQNIGYQGRIQISLTLEDSFLSCKIEDNGRGIDVQTTSKDKTSTATDLIHSFLRKTTGRGLQTKNKRDLNPEEPGVIVTFLIPTKNSEHD